MILDLPESSVRLMDSFKAKLRSQIKKPLREGLTSRIGGREFLDDFYKVFSVNMRDLGSPVHSKELISQVLDVFSESARIVMIHKDETPVACSVVIGFGDTLENPWASALREYSRLSPNMLLYWSMLEYACENGFRHFDFGRSSPDEGTYRFKEQWGAKPLPLHWQYISGAVGVIEPVGVGVGRRTFTCLGDRYRQAGIVSLGAISFVGNEDTHLNLGSGRCSTPTRRVEPDVNIEIHLLTRGDRFPGGWV